LAISITPFSVTFNWFPLSLAILSFALHAIREEKRMIRGEIGQFECVFGIQQKSKIGEIILSWFSKLIYVVFILVVFLIILALFLAA